MLVRCFSLACNKDHEANDDEIRSGHFTCPSCNGDNSMTWGRIRYQNRAVRDQQAEEFQSCRH